MALGGSAATLSSAALAMQGSSGRALFGAGGPSTPPSGPPPGEGFFDEPFIDEALAGTITETFRSGYDNGLIWSDAGGDFGGHGAFNEDHCDVVAVTNPVHAGTRACDFRNVDLLGDPDWRSNSSAKMFAGISEAHTPEAWPVGVGTSLYYQAALFLPSNYPACGTTLVHKNHVNVLQLKSANVTDPGAFDVILYMVLQQRTGDNTKIQLNLRRNNNAPAAWGDLTLENDTDAALVTRGVWHIVTMWCKTGTEAQGGAFKYWMDGVKLADVSPIDTVTDISGGTSGVSTFGYDLYPSHMPIGSTVVPNNLFWDTVQVWGVE